MSYTWSNESCLSILVLSEDKATDASDTLAHLAAKAARLVDSECRTQRIEFEPASRTAQSILSGNLWKSSQRSHRQQRVTLVKSIATKINETEGYVLFHIDGDRKWADKSTSENVDKFNKLIRNPVKELLRSKKTSDDKAEELIQRLILWVPFYSIEAWLYQNTDVAIQLCEEHHRGTDRTQFENWKENRELLDELEQTKFKTCLGSTYNLRLASERFPADEVRKVGKSFSDAVECFRNCKALVESLSTTH